MSQFIKSQPEFKTGEYDVALTKAFATMDAYLISPKGKKELYEVVHKTQGENN
jgi:hypothetical protein